MTLLDALEMSFRKPCVELCRPTFAVEEQLLPAFTGFALADHLLNIVAIFGDLVHLYWILRTFELLNDFIDDLKYSTWSVLFSLDKQVLIGSIWGCTPFRMHL